MSKSLMLKDYLLEDMSSCSSNGFRSFPRRQCCTTTVRFLLEIDLRVTDSSLTKRFNPARIASRKIAISTISTLHKASDAVFRAFKQFPFPSSRKLILRPFWKKLEVKRCKSFQEFLDEKEPPSSVSDRNLAVVGRNSIFSVSSWTESEFTLEMIPSSSSGVSESCSENDAVKDGEDSPGDVVGESDGVMFDEDPIEESTAAAAYREEAVKEWRNEEELKEQLSPVSVLDFPFELDEDEDMISSSFNSNLHLIQGKKQKHNQKRKQTEKGAELEPIDLKKRFENSNLISKKEHQREQKALELLNIIKSSSSSSTKSQCFIIKTENLLLDFFDEKLEQIESISHRIGGSHFEQQVLKLTQDWINGGAGETMIVGWESAEGRKLYIVDMEMAGMWRSFAGEEEELAAEVEAEIWMSLLNELLIDLL